MTYDYICYFDGACEPKNPGGNMGIGAIILDGNRRVIKELSFFVPARPENSNNVAEYQGFGWVVSRLSEIMLDGQNAIIHGDSKLVIEQMAGRWGIKQGQYVQHAVKAKTILTALKDRCAISLQWIPRDQNDICDRLSKSPMIEKGVEFKLQRA